MGVLEEGGRVAGGVIDAMRGQPLAIANIVLNLAFLIFLFYYVSRISARAETTVAAMYAANDKLYVQWGVIIKDMGELAEKSLHCVTIDDALKLMRPPAQPQRDPLGDNLPTLPPLRLLREDYP